MNLHPAWEHICCPNYLLSLYNVYQSHTVCLHKNTSTYQNNYSCHINNLLEFICFVEEFCGTIGNSSVSVCYILQEPCSKNVCSLLHGFRSNFFEQYYQPWKNTFVLVKSQRRSNYSYPQQTSMTTYKRLCFVMFKMNQSL